MKTATFLFFLIPSIVFALTDGPFSKTIQHDSYRAAQKSMNYIKFNMESTKLGMITTDFDGHAKEFTVTGNKSGNILKGLKIIIPIQKLDTDNSSRDDKMHGYCLAADQFKNIEISLGKSIRIGKEYASLPAEMLVRGKKKAINFPIKTKAANGRILAEGNFQLNLDNLDIPDPSIMIAKVKKDFKINYHVVIE